MTNITFGKSLLLKVVTLFFIGGCGWGSELNDPIKEHIKITGPDTLGINQVGEYYATMENVADLQFVFDWGDSNTSEWVDSFALHAWTDTGTYAVRAKARNRYDTLSISGWFSNKYVSVKTLP